MWFDVAERVGGHFGIASRHPHLGSARATDPANDPKLVLMDEPTAMMAPAERYALMEQTARIVRERNIAVLFTEQDMDVVFGHADRVLVLNRGALIAEGTPDTIRADSHVQEVHLGAGTKFQRHAPYS